MMLTGAVGACIGAVSALCSDRYLLSLPFCLPGVELARLLGILVSHGCPMAGYDVAALLPLNAFAWGSLGVVTGAILKPR